MRKLVVSLFVLTALVFTSCESDDDGSSSSNIQGTWKLTAWNSVESFDLNNDGVASTNLLDEMDCYNNETIVFANNVATAISTSYADITAEIVVGTTNEFNYSIDCEQEFSSDDAIFTVNGNTVTITTTEMFDGEVSENVLVATINGNTLSFVVEEGLYIYNDANFDTVVEQDLTFVYTKQ